MIDQARTIKKGLYELHRKNDIQKSMTNHCDEHLDQELWDS